MKIDNLWPTPIGQTEGGISPQATAQLAALIRRREVEKKKVPLGANPFKAFVDDGDFYHSIHYNLFDAPDDLPEREAIREFEAFACRTVRHYLREGFGAVDADTVELSARCFGHSHIHGVRTFPHYHQASDVVLIHYLTVGTPMDAPLSLIMLDPRGAPNYPWWGKMHVVNPKSGTTICHPSFLWHETNEWTGESSRELIAVNFKIIGHGHERQFNKTEY